MAIWDALLKRAIQPIINESLDSMQDDSLGKGLVSQMANSTFASPYTMSTGTKKMFSKNIPHNTLRDFSLHYPILRACINYRKRQISQLDWDIAPKEVVIDPDKKEAYKKDSDAIKKMLRHPTGESNMSFRDFVNRVLEDLLVIDAIAVYKRKTKGGSPYGYLPIDAATIDLVLNEDGTTPKPPQEAYLQVINGEVVNKLTIDELIYRVMNPRTYTPYGLSPVESLILTVTTALKLASYNLGYLTEGNVPEGFVELPKDIASSADQIAIWQDKWDAMFSGDPRMTRKLKFLPEGMKLHETKKVDDMEFERFDKWLLLNTCSVMEVPPQAIGFQFDRGKGATEAEWEIGKERGLFPVAHFLKEIMDDVIENDLKKDHLQFVWTNINPTNKKEEADVFGQLVKSGAVSVDEWRIAEGYEPIGLGHYIMSPVGPIMVKDFIVGSGMRQEVREPFNPGATQPDQAKPPADEPPSTNPQTPPKGSESEGEAQKINFDIEERVKHFSQHEVVEELKRWKKVVVKDFKQGRSFRDFKTDVIDTRTQVIIKEGLKTARSKEELDDLFDPLISEENKIINAMLDLYDEIAGITKDHAITTADTSTKSN